MRRRYMIIGGIVLALLLFGGGLILIRPMFSGTDANPNPSGPNPTGVGAVSAEPDDTVITLRWDAVEGAAGYFIYRDEGSLPLNPTPVTETHYIDIGLTNGRTYTYQIAPTDATGIPGKRSVEVKVAPNAK